MRKLLPSLAIAVALAGLAGGTAAAETQRADDRAAVAGGVVGYFKEYKDCLNSRAKYDLRHQVGPCQKNPKLGWYFKYS